MNSENQTENNGYSVFHTHWPKLDLMIYEVSKPSTKRPFTLFVFGYSKKGHAQFFEDITMLDQWEFEYPDDASKIPDDTLFLEHVWNNVLVDPLTGKSLKDLRGEFDASEISHDTDREPCVYRVKTEDAFKLRFGIDME